LREAIYELLSRRGRFKEFLARPVHGISLGFEGDGLVWRIGDASDRDLLRPIAVSAANLMTGPKACRVRQCQDDRGCGWLFIDESRALNRRWCSMDDCGNGKSASAPGVSIGAEC